MKKGLYILNELKVLAATSVDFVFFHLRHFFLFFFIAFLSRLCFVFSF
jgi:hypothetical protein